jgi:hypothetical protein
VGHTKTRRLAAGFWIGRSGSAGPRRGRRCCQTSAPSVACKPSSATGRCCLQEERQSAMTLRTRSLAARAPAASSLCTRPPRADRPSLSRRRSRPFLGARPSFDRRSTPPRPVVRNDELSPISRAIGTDPATARPKGQPLTCRRGLAPRDFSVPEVGELSGKRALPFRLPSRRCARKSTTGCARAPRVGECASRLMAR